ALAAKYLKGGKESKLYKDLLREIEGMKKDLNQLREQLRDDTIEKIRANRTGAIEAAILQLEESLRVRKEQEDQLQKKVENLRARTRLVSESSEEIDAIRAEIAAIENLTGQMAGEMDSLKLELKAPDRITRIGDSYTFPPTTSRKQVMSTWGAGAGAFGLVL